ncbi:MAG: glycosyltransferase family 2 protein [Cyclobacteriaceae bacterium]
MQYQNNSTLISVVDWKNEKTTQKCIESIYANLIAVNSFEVALVRNSYSESITYDWLDQYKNLVVIDSKLNLGFAGGHNLAVEYFLKTDHKFIWLLNNDCLLTDLSLDSLLMAYQTKGDGIYGSVSIKDDDSEQLLHSGYQDQSDWTLPGDLFDEFEGRKLNLLKPDKIRWVPVIHGHSMFIPRSIVKEYGFLRTDYFLYYEEIEYCLRLLSLGVKSYIVNSSVVVHLLSDSTKHSLMLRNIIFYYKSRNKLFLNRDIYKKNLVKMWAESLLFILSRLVFLLRRGLTKEKLELIAHVHFLVGLRGQTIKPDRYR